jgi:predicted TIM-barrel fold metal-dependent hydrolase
MHQTCDDIINVVDAQIHLWGSGLPSNPSHRQVTRFDAEEAVTLMDQAGVSAAVIHPPSWDPGSVAMAQRAVADYPGRFAIMGSVSVNREDAEASLRAWQPGLAPLGYRLILLHEPARSLVAERQVDWLWHAAEQAGLPMTMLATDSLAALGDVAERFPGLKLTIDHLGGRGGLTTLKDAEAMTHMPELLALARFPNVAVKVTGVPGYARSGYPFKSMHPYLRQIFDAFGPTRMFWGTDISKMPCTWRECITLFTEELAWLSGADLQLVMGDAICQWWGWDRSAAPQNLLAD